MGEKNEIKVLKCNVRFEGDVAVFHETLVSVKGTIRKMSGSKIAAEKNVSYTLDLDGVPVCDALVPMGASVRIAMAVIRDRDDFEATADRLNGATVHFTEVSEWTERDGKGRLPVLVKWLVSTDKFTEEQAREINSDPVRKAKAQALFDALMKAAPVDDL